jgi:hypothetical protein
MGYRGDFGMSRYKEMIKYTHKNNQAKYGRSEVEFELHMQEQRDIWSIHNELRIPLTEVEEGVELNDVQYLLLNGMTKQHAKRLGLEGILQ